MQTMSLNEMGPGREGAGTALDRLNITQRYLATEFADGYEDGVLPRRDLIERVARITGGIGTAASVLLALGIRPTTSSAQSTPPMYSMPGDASSPASVSPNDPAIVASDVIVPSGGVEVAAYLARPVGDGPFPAVMICHENAGTAEHFRDVARRFAKVGYVAIHLDLLSREGGTEAVPANQRAAALTAPGKAELFVDDFRAAMAMLRADLGVRGDAIGMTGYCFGGSVTWNVACREPGLRAAVPFYGPPGFPEELGEIRASCLGVYGDSDARVNASIPVVEKALRSSGVAHDLRVYAGAGHAFFNDTRPQVYAEEASMQAWRDTLEWFSKHLA